MNQAGRDHARDRIESASYEEISIVQRAGSSSARKRNPRNSLQSVFSNPSGMTSPPTTPKTKASGIGSPDQQLSTTTASGGSGMFGQPERRGENTLGYHSGSPGYGAAEHASNHHSPSKPSSGRSESARQPMSPSYSSGQLQAYSSDSHATQQQPSFYGYTQTPATPRYTSPAKPRK